MPEYAFAFGAALAWAVAAQFVNLGLERMPRQHRGLHIALGLLVSLAAGAVLLAVVTLLLGAVARLSLWIVLAGLFTFPLGTGLYYLVGQAFSGRTEHASQFANVKPALSILLAVLILGERLQWPSVLAIALVAAGIVSLLAGARARHFSLAAVLTGLLLATTWALGELFMGLALDGRSSLGATFLALAIGALAWACLCGPVLLHRRGNLDVRASWLAPFVVHGAISFCLAYALFFESIDRIGLSQSILISAFWPPFAVLLAVGLGRMRSRHRPVPVSILVAAALLVSASVLQIRGM